MEVVNEIGSIPYWIRESEMHSELFHKGVPVMNIKWDYSYYQPWSDKKWLVDEMIAIWEETLMAQNKDITMQ